MSESTMAFASDSFIEGFLRPRILRVTSGFFTSPARELRPGNHIYLLIGETLDAAGIDLDWLLLLEAIDWLALGVDQGLLPADVATSPSVERDVWEKILDFRRELHPLIGAELRRGVELNSKAFWLNLVSSNRSLTPSHYRFLSLMHCASDHDWELQMSDVARFTEQFGRTGLESLGRQTIDVVSWALSGSELDDHRGDPAAWRAAWLRPQGLDGSAYEYGPYISANRERAAARYRQLADARSTIIDALEVHLNAASGQPGALQSGDAKYWKA